MTGAAVDWDHMVGIPVFALDSGLFPSSQCKITTKIERAVSNTAQLLVVITVRSRLHLIISAARASFRLAVAVVSSHSSSIQPFLDTSGGGE